MHIVFFSTSDVFDAEERLKQANVQCSIVPTPVTDKAYCGVCISTEDKSALILLSDMEGKVVE
ncbi:MAG: DUF3343 domain-containing protein [Paludibacteraceae bacterium]|nr:DUF3343 domain-containing protein [Paludibacteraceae bacterium]